MEGKFFRITLLRHGETIANERLLYSGATDVPLSPHGIQGILDLKRAGTYAGLDVAAFYTSGLQRTEETLRLIFGDRAHEQADGLREMNFGRFEMHSHEELKDSPAYQAWILDQTGLVACPGGESDRGFRQRVYLAFERIVQKQQDALIVCHSGVIARLMAHCFPDDPRRYYDWQPSTGRGFTAEFSGRHARLWTPVP